RARARADVEEAYRLQVKSGIQGAVQSTGLGVGLAILGHYYWPAFRRHTLQFKAFLISGFTLTGLVFGAESALLAYEAERRRAENSIRKAACLDLARRGLVGTESEIEKWRAEREQ
ncbi:hypothetical protein PLICRDRAFT_76249, partial [Plicaturopsis crispa FD-325 SS-3]